MGNLSPGRQYQLQCARREIIDNGLIWEDAGAAHMRAMHKGLSNSELLGRVFDRNLDRASTFRSEHDMRMCVEDCLVYNLRNIYESILPYTTCDGEKFPITFRFKEEI